MLYALQDVLKKISGELSVTDDQATRSWMRVWNNIMLTFVQTFKHIRVIYVDVCILLVCARILHVCYICVVFCVGDKFTRAYE